MTGNITYVATAGADKIITAKAAVLHKIIIGKDVSTSTIEVSDSPSDGDGNVKILLTGDALMTANGGEVEVNAVFLTGISADLTAQTNTTFVWSPTQ